ncbi:unnamed protein product [Hermetia illucens]|uniref:Type-1 angiotensin II receptor-associated protein n=1 Tax=Hermetia illucens TaxID=343691 RepID=A0A7R8Z2T2_HERIL|nr:type-1 angiotensin II receptor-associated protein [Hermetia illucens]CAD7091217.1 unnamed protein product [Hermetia illucens]
MTEISTLMGSPFVRVKLVTFVHFIFIANAMLTYTWPTAFLFYNILFIISLMWTIHCKESTDAVHTAVLIDACSIVFDLICIISFYYPINGWALAFSIINLICRPFSALLLHREFTERGGTMTTGTIFPTTQQRTYQDIDRPTQPVPTNNQGPNVASIF